MVGTLGGRGPYGQMACVGQMYCFVWPCMARGSITLGVGFVPVAEP